MGPGGSGREATYPWSHSQCDPTAAETSPGPVLQEDFLMGKWIVKELRPQRSGLHP